MTKRRGNSCAAYTLADALPRATSRTTTAERPAVSSPTAIPARASAAVNAPYCATPIRPITTIVMNPNQIGLTSRLLPLSQVRLRSITRRR